MIYPKTVSMNFKANTSRGEFEVIQQAHELNEDYQYRWSLDTVSMKMYVIGIGFRETYLENSSTREVYSTSEDRLSLFRSRLRRRAVKNGDRILNWRLVYAHDIGHVRQCYPEAK